VRIYTRRGDDGTTGLLYGGRVPKSSARIEVNGTVDEAQAALGMARAEAEPGSELDELLVGIERDLYVLMAEVATAPAHRDRLVAGTTLVTPAMVAGLEARIDDLTGRFEMPGEFVVPGDNRCAAALDLARTVVRRAERSWDAAGLDSGGPGADAGDAGRVGDAGDAGDGDGGSQVGPYLNRLSDLVWTMARWQEGDRHLIARTSPRRRSSPGGAGGPGGSGAPDSTGAPGGTGGGDPA
jgi:cob(I)alamin adenosyltransferase